MFDVHLPNCRGPPLAVSQTVPRILGFPYSSAAARAVRAAVRRGRAADAVDDARHDHVTPAHAPREESTMSTFDNLAIPGRLEALLASERGVAPSRAELRAATDLGDALAGQVVARVLEDEVSAPADAPRAYLAARAAALAGELRLTSASAALVRCIERPENDLLGWQAFRALEAIGIAALEPLLAAFASTKDPEVRRRTAELLARTRADDSRVHDALLALLQENAAAGACRLADYADPRFVPALQRALDAATLDDPPDERGEDDAWREPHEDVCQLASAIETLGGTLSASRQAKLEEALRRRDDRFAATFGDIGEMPPAAQPDAPADAAAPAKRP
jgi:hypothetical protein